nr:hypothetical protein BaRGS_007478 [Batillaria attramentaria]
MPHYHCVAIGFQNGSSKSDKQEKFPETVLPNDCGPVHKMLKIALEGQMNARLDRLAEAGLPIWLTELDCQSTDENKRADFYEKVLRAFYGHPAVEGIMFWGFWDQRHWRGERAALVKGNDLQCQALKCCH